MSKAFTKESDQTPDEPSSLARRATLPPGAKNYMTSDGAQRLRNELERLVEQERPLASNTAVDDDGRRNLQGIDQRIRLLGEILQSAVITEPPTHDLKRIRFGASVTVRDEPGVEEQFRIVGVDETEFSAENVSWLSPIGKALLNAQEGDHVTLYLPSGARKLTIIGVQYPAR